MDKFKAVVIFLALCAVVAHILATAERGGKDEEEEEE